MRPPVASSVLRWASRLPCPTHLRFKPRKEYSPSFTSLLMDEETLPSLGRMKATARICTVSSFSTELLEMHSEEPSLHIVFVPGNPGIVSFYKDFIEAIYELLQGSASITAIGHISHTGKDWEHGRMFSLQEQVDHKVDFIKQELHLNEAPMILVGHSIGSYICLEIFKKLPQQVKFAIGLYPFLTLNRDSLKQSMIGMIARSSIISAAVSSFVSVLGSFPTYVSSALMRRFLGQSWSATAVDAACSHLMQYHTIRNVLFMAMTEFTQRGGLKKMFLSEEWATSKFAKMDEGKETEKIMTDASFWRKLEQIHKTVQPLVYVLKLVDGDAPTMGVLYDEMDKAKLAIANAHDNNQAKYQKYWDVIDERWNSTLHSPLHAAGYFLNPAIRYRPDVSTHPEIRRGLQQVIGRIEPDLNDQLDAINQLSEEPDWMFMKKKQNQIALLFGIDDHWGPLSLFDEISKQVPGIALSIEREGHTHAFCCTEAGSNWVARHVTTLIKNQIPTS